jgi:hypothetical protein
VVINDFNRFWPRLRPDKTESELVVAADAVLAGAITAGRSEPSTLSFLLAM